MRDEAFYKEHTKLKPAYNVLSEIIANTANSSDPSSKPSPRSSRSGVSSVNSLISESVSVGRGETHVCSKLCRYT